MKEKMKMIGGMLQKTLVDPHLLSKIVSPENFKDVVNEANRDYLSTEFEYGVLYNLPFAETKNRYKKKRIIKCLRF